MTYKIIPCENGVGEWEVVGEDIATQVFDLRSDAMHYLQKIKNNNSRSNFFEEINTNAPTIKPYPFYKITYMGKVKLSNDAEIWGGLWKRFYSIRDGHVMLEKHRAVSLDHIDQFKFTREAVKKKFT